MKTPAPITLSALIPPDLTGFRLDQALSQLFPEHSRARLQTFIRNQQVTLNGSIPRPRDKVKEGDAVLIEALIEPVHEDQAENIPLSIVYEDDSLLVINKPIGLVVHPAAGNRQGTLMNGLLHHCPALSQIPRAGIIHRLDKGTSGLLVIAKTLTAHTHLVKQLQARTMRREYQAIVSGVLTGGGMVDQPIGRHPRERKRMAVGHHGKTAITHYRVIKRYRAYTHIRVFLETGRTHQIRVHMAHIRHPVVGDPLYAGRFQIPPQTDPTLIMALRTFKHQALHAETLGLLHPETHATMQWTAPIPDDLQQLLGLLEANEASLKPN